MSKATTTAAAAETPTTTCECSNTKEQQLQQPYVNLGKEGIQSNNIINTKMNKTSIQKIRKTDVTKSLPSFDVKACWSKAGIGTCFVLEEVNHKKFDIVFDIGWYVHMCYFL